MATDYTTPEIVSKFRKGIPVERLTLSPLMLELAGDVNGKKCLILAAEMGNIVQNSKIAEHSFSESTIQFFSCLRDPDLIGQLWETLGNYPWKTMRWISYS